MDADHWFGVKFADLDVEGWLPFLEAATIGMRDAEKVTLPLSRPQSADFDTTREAA